MHLPSREIGVKRKVVCRLFYVIHREKTDVQTVKKFYSYTVEKYLVSLS